MLRHLNKISDLLKAEKNNKKTKTKEITIKNTAVKAAGGWN